MLQTEDTAIVVRYVNYRDNDRMLTLFSPTRGRLEVIARGCRRPKSPLLAASELFALGDFQLYEKAGRHTLTSATLTETFYPLREQYDRLACGMYLLEVCEAAILPEKNDQELFMLLLHTLSRLTFSDQPWQPLLSGFLIHYANLEGYRPRLKHCVRCGRKPPEDAPIYFDMREGGLCCQSCHGPWDKTQQPLSRAQTAWMEHALRSGSASWVNTPEAHAPLGLLRAYVEQRLDRPVRSASALPKEVQP